MGVLKEIYDIVSEAEQEYFRLKALPNYVNFNNIWQMGEEDNRLYLGENLQLIRALSKKEKYSKKVKMIYLDPPFYSKSNYDANLDVGSSCEKKAIKTQAYKDVWKSGFKEYLKMLAIRLYFMKDLLSDEGTIWVHLDWHSVHYVKILLDEIFGYNNFINDIVWTYKSGGSSKRHFARKHDNILIYSKTKDYYINVPKEKSYNRGLKPYKFKGVDEFQDEVGWYTFVNMKDVWSLDMVGRTAKERTGYATQKPELLVKRIIEASTNEGDICCDFFSGSGTLAKVCNDLNRRFLCCDKSKAAYLKSVKRLIESNCDFKGYLDFKYNFTRTEAELKGEVLQALTPEEVIINLKLVDYNINLKDEIPGTGDNGKLSELLIKNPKSFVDMVSIDFSLDGINFKTIANEIKKESAVDNVETTVNTHGQSEIYVRTKVVDIFGNINMRVDTIPLYWNDSPNEQIKKSLN